MSTSKLQPTKEEITQEIIKCGKDPVYFIKNYCRIVHQTRGIIPFKLYEFQEQLVRDLISFRFNIILKSRQMGISTVMAAFVLWLSIFQRSKETSIIAHKETAAANVLRKTKMMYDHLPKWIKILSKIKSDSKTTLEIENGSRIQALSSSPDAARSEALSLLILDEAAIMPEAEELYTGAQPTVSTGGRVVILSTPKGTGNFFYKKYVEAENGENDFHITKLPWYLNPDYTQEWFDDQTRNMSPRQIAQEFECNFNASGQTVIDPEDILKMQKFVKDPIARIGIDRNVWIWREPDPSCQYLLCGDVSRGDANSCSVFHVINLNTMYVDAEYRGKLTPDDYAMLVIDIAKRYNTALVVIENNHLGYMALKIILNQKYPRIFYSHKGSGEVAEELEYLYSNSKIVPGLTTSTKSRPLYISKLEEYIRRDIIHSNSVRLLNELRVFIWADSGKPVKASRTDTDDLVLALSIGCWVRDTVLTGVATVTDHQKAIVNNFAVVTKNINFDDKALSRTAHNLTAEQERIRTMYKQYMWVIKE